VLVFLICFCRVLLGVTCPYGERCTQAHSEEELAEWKEYFDDWRSRLQSETDKQSDRQFAEQLLEKWMNAENPETVVSCCILHIPCHILHKSDVYCCEMHMQHTHNFL